MLARALTKSVGSWRPLPYKSATTNLPLPVSYRTGGTALTTVTDETATTWTGADIGEWRHDRIVVVGGYSGHTTNAVTVTVAGYQHYYIQQNSAFFMACVLVPLQVSLATIVVSCASSVRKAIGVYAVYSQSPLPVDDVEGSNSGGSPLSISDVQGHGGGCLVYYGGAGASTITCTTTWSDSTDPVSEDMDAQLEATTTYTWGHVVLTRSATLSDLTLTKSGSAGARLQALTFLPPRP